MEYPDAHPSRSFRVLTSYMRLLPPLKVLSIILPKSDDKLFIITDGAVRKPGIAATYDVTRRGNITGFFSENLKALPIAAAVQHFDPYVI